MKRLLVLAVAVGALAWPPPDGTAQEVRLASVPTGAGEALEPPSLTLDRRAGIDVEDVTPSEALIALRDRSGVRLLFSPTLLPDDVSITCPCEDRTIREALHRILEGTGFRFTAENRQILIERDARNRRSADSDEAPLSESVANIELVDLPPESSWALRYPEPQQRGTVTGRVTDRSAMRLLAGAQVYVQGTEIGALTNAEGRYILLNVPAGEVTILVEIIGFATASQTVTVRADEASVVNFALELRAISMEEIVVTGVAAETPRSQLAFSVAKLPVAETQPVPTPTVGGLLQAKIPGVKVVLGSGLEGSEPSFMFRGPTSISGGQAPLIVVDGVITQFGGIAELNTLDIESIEVVKGAAAAALYGSRAQAGVLEITTKSGSRIGGGETQVSVRTTFEANNLEHTLGFNRGHPWRMDAAGNFLGFDGKPAKLPNQGRVLAFNDGRNGRVATRAFADQEFPPPTFDPMRQFYNPGNRIKTNVAVSGSREGSEFFISGAYTREEGVIDLKPPLQQWNARLNLTQRIAEDLRLRATAYYSQWNRHLVDEQGGFVRQLTFLTAKADLLRPDPDEPGGISHVGELIDIANVAENPVNRLINTTHEEDRSRFMGGLEAVYTPVAWLSLSANLSFDRGESDRIRFQRPGLGRLLLATRTVGELLIAEDQREELNASLTMASNRQFGDLTVRNRVRWLVERQDRQGFTAGGSGLPVDQVPRLGIITGTPDIDSFEHSIRSEGFFLINAFTYKDRYIVDALIRRDGSSLFGADERWQTYWRLSGAWRIAQEPWFRIGFLNEFKPRYSIGTSGGRPSFEAQYQTYGIARGQVIPRTLGNRDLKPELATEQEFGLDMVIAQRLQVEANYVDTKVEDQLLLVPLPSQLGFEAQWRNGGTIESKTWELSLEAAILERRDMRWTARLNLDRTKARITKLNMPPYEIIATTAAAPGVPARLSRSKMMVREGEMIGSFYGFKWLSSCADLAAGLPCDQFDVNDWGHLVWVGSGNTWRDGIAKDLWGTVGSVGGRTFRWGHPIEPDPDSPLKFTKLGDSQPDLNASLRQDFHRGNLGVAFVLEGEWGAKIYNFSQQWQCRDWHCALADMRGVPDERKKPITYISALQARNDPNNFFIEAADFVKLRELSVRYTVAADRLPAMLRRSGFKEATINLVGRNLKTWTDYRGFDPEVGIDSFGGSAVVGRVDEWFVPNFRSFGIDVELIF